MFSVHGGMGMEGKNFHRDMLRKLYSNGRWFQVCRDMFAAFSLEQAVALSYLCNVGQQRGKEWIRCSREKMLRNLRISRRVHDRIMAELERLGVIKRRQAGSGAKRYVRVDYERMHRLIEGGLAKESREAQVAFASEPPNGGS